jgi:exonuclease SbcD
MSQPLHIIHVSDIHFGSGEVHGPLNPDTGLNVRFEDFVTALDKVVDYAIGIDADVFLFSGDAYKTANPEPIYQKMFATRLKRLSDSGIKTILLVGNHDQILRSTNSHAMSVFQSLSVPGVITIDKPVLTTIETKRGKFQLIGLPHVTRHQLVTIEKYANLGAAEIDRLLVEQVSAILRGFYQELDPNLPTIATAHMTLDRALAGIEQELLVGYTLTFPTDIFVHEHIDYVAMGHVHKYQIIRDSKPAVVYAGSLERVDFGEEKEDKGFVHVELSRGNTKYSFRSINPRPFITLDVNLINASNPTKTLIDAITKVLVPGCVLRVRYKIKQEQLAELDEKAIKQAAASALTVRLLPPEIEMDPNRTRMPQLSESIAASPMAALETYLTAVAPERKEVLVARAQTIMEELRQELHNEDCNGH